MAIFSYTYATLKTAIANWTEDDSSEFSDVLDDVIGLAELRIYREADLDVFRKYATTTGTQADRYLAKPTDFVLDRWMYITVSGSEVYLTQKDVSWIADYWPKTTNEDQPLYYADWDDDTLVICPTPDAAYKFTMAYTYRPARLDSNNTTSWLGTNAPDVLLFACLVESEGFLEGMDRGQEPGMFKVWEAKYQQALQHLRDEEMRRQRRTERRQGESHGEV